MRGHVVCFGELLLRLGAPAGQLLLQSPLLEVFTGGAEANVAVSLARFGHRAEMVGVVAGNALGESAAGELRRHAVGTQGLQTAPGRMGLYFLTPGAMHRPSDVIYDRADSAFARTGGGVHDWAALLAGADWLHVSGVSPALGQLAADGTLRAVRAARQAGVKVSFDGNFRPKLWAAWRGDAANILRQVMAEADLLFASHRDIEVVLGTPFTQTSYEDRFRAGAQAAFDAFPHLQRMAATHRIQHSVDHHELSALEARRDGSSQVTPAYQLAAIVDRIGTGDAFAAGVLHGEITGMAPADGLNFGLAAACLKHSIPGDFNLVGVAEVSALVGGKGFDVRR
ncbi:MAG: sugar kinase [Pseudoxanthomonas sp.]